MNVAFKFELLILKPVSKKCVPVCFSCRETKVRIIHCFMKPKLTNNFFLQKLVDLVFLTDQSKNSSFIFEAAVTFKGGKSIL